MISIKEFENNPMAAEALFDLLRERVFLKTELDIVYSDLVNWERSNLLSIGGDSDKGDWKKLNYVEYIWVKIIQELRQFGFNYEEIEIYKGELFTQVKLNDILDAAHMDKLNLEEQLDQESILKINSLNNDIIDKNINVGYSYFESIVVNAICKREKWALLFFKEMPGLFLPFSTEMFRGFDVINKSDSFQKMLTKTFLSISLSDIISKFLVEGEDSFHIKTISILTKEEHGVLKHIRKGYKNIKSIQIRFNNQQMDRIEITTIKKVKLESRLIDYIKKGDYQSISIDTVDGKIAYFENTQKHKLKDTE